MPFYRLRHGEFLVLPVPFETFDKLGPSDAVIEHFWQLTHTLAEIARRCSVHGPIAYVATDYFGGTGTQAAAAWNAGEIVEEPDVGKGSRVNIALGAIGLEREPGLDAFDTLGLGDVRSMSDFSKRPRQK